MRQTPAKRIDCGPACWSGTMITPRQMRGAALCLLLAGGAACNAYVEPGAPPMIVVGAPNGPQGSGDGGPPANLESDAMDEIPALGGSRSGIYSGQITPLDTAGGLCTSSQSVDHFRVRGKSVRWQDFRGRITGNGLQMQHGNMWIIGEFEDGNRFSGQVGAYGPNQPPGCTFRIRLAKTAN